MKIKTIINGVYREEAPTPEEGSPAAGGAPPVEEAIVPEDEGQDSIPEEVNLWETLSNDVDDDDVTEELPEEPAEDSPSEDVLDVPTPEEEPAEPEAEPATETPAEPVAADTAIPEEPEVQPTPEPEPEPIPQLTAEEQTQARTARKTEIETTLADRFQLSSEEALQLVTDPGKVFPKLQARMFTDMWLHVEAMIDQRLPQVIESTQREMKIRDEKVDDFFKVWPQLDRVKHGKQVAQVAAVFSGVNKTATEKEVIESVGMQVMMMNGITPDLIPTPEAPAETPATPYRPATVNGAPSAPQRSSDNLYENMSIELEDDED